MDVNSPVGISDTEVTYMQAAHRTVAVRCARHPPLIRFKKKRPPVGWSFLEQGTGVEPASEAWEATIIADILTLHVGVL